MINFNVEPEKEDLNDIIEETVQATGSSNINKFGYNSKTKTLYVEFKNEARYEYSNVTSDLFEAIKSKQFSAADGHKSYGATFAKLIKDHPAQFPFRKIR